VTSVRMPTVNVWLPPLELLLPVDDELQPAATSRITAIAGASNLIRVLRMSSPFDSASRPHRVTQIVAERVPVCHAGQPTRGGPRAGAPDARRRE
jgi:hypothetical protein